MIGLPERIFFCGAPGSRWSGIAQQIEMNPSIDTSDRTPNRQYSHHNFGGHVGAYYGTGMEFPPVVDKRNLKKPYYGMGIPLLKSHEWCYRFNEIVAKFPYDWIVLVYRNDQACFDWWKDAGGWKISYPNYDWYENDKIMMKRIKNVILLIHAYAK